jgi:CheY-like chemotaxis protein
LTRVMIVDDDRTMVKLLQTLLELDGFEVSVARLGNEVIERATQFQPDVFLMDYHLPDVDGVEILRQVRAGGPFASTPVVIASGLDVEEEVMAAGANAFLVKPFEPDELPDLLQKLIEQ